MWACYYKQMKRDTGVDAIDADVWDALQRDKLDKWRSTEANNTQELVLDKENLLIGQQKQTKPELNLM